MGHEDLNAPEPRKPATPSYWLVGCGACLALAGITILALLIVAGLVAKKKTEEMRSAVAARLIVSQEEELADLLHDDPARLDRSTAIFKILEKDAIDGDLKAAGIDALQRKIDLGTRDGDLTPAEADEILDAAERLEK